MVGKLKRFSLIFVLAFLIAVVSSVSFVGSAYAALVFHSGFETGDFSEWTSVTGAVTISSPTQKTGLYSCKVSMSGTGLAYFESTLAATQYRVTLYRYTAGTALVFLTSTTGTGSLSSIYSDPNYILRLTINGTNYDGTTAVSSDTRHRICVACGASDTRVYLNGNLEITADATTSFTGAIRIGKPTADTVYAVEYFDDISYDATQSSEDLGDIRVLRASPIADSAVNDTWKNEAAGAITWSSVDECPAVTTDYAWVEADGTLLAQTWTTTSMTTLGIDGMTPNAISSWFYYATGAGGANEYYTYMRDNGTDYSTGIDDPIVATWINRYDAVMPNGGGAWTEARCDAFEIGMATSDARKDVWCYTAYKMIAYTYSAGGEADIANTPDSESLGVVAPSTTYYAYGSAPSNPVGDGECTFTVTNNSGAAVDITIEADNFTGGVGWALTSGAPGENTVKMIAYYSGQNPASGVTLTTSPQAFISALADNTSEFWDFSLTTGTFTDGAEKTSTITLSAALS